MNDDTIRSSLSDAVNEINKLIELTGDPDQLRQLHCLRDFFFDLWEAVIKQDLDDTTPLYAAAITTLRDAETAATTAQTDISKIADAISKAAAAAKAVDQVVNLGLNVAKYFP
jgi:hypothetical protein